VSDRQLFAINGVGDRTLKMVFITITHSLWFERQQLRSKEQLQLIWEERENNDDDDSEIKKVF
jgi:hypothetical protein